LTGRALNAAKGKKDISRFILETIMKGDKGLKNADRKKIL